MKFDKTGRVTVDSLSKDEANILILLLKNDIDQAQRLMLDVIEKFSLWSEK